MRLPIVASLLALAALASCSSDSPTGTCCTTGDRTVRVVNAYGAPVDVLIDGDLAIAGLASGVVDTAHTVDGSHTLTFRPAGRAPGASQSIMAGAEVLNTIAAVRSANGTVSAAALDDTNSVVPAGATKLRVLHLAPNAGELQVYRTQPDYQTPTAWQFPFTYQAEPTALSAPFYRSTVGTWEVRIWQTPTNSSGWATAPVKVVLPLASGEKRTILMLDAPGGGVRVEVI